MGEGRRIIPPLRHDKAYPVPVRFRPLRSRLLPGAAPHEPGWSHPISGQVFARACGHLSGRSRAAVGLSLRDIRQRPLQVPDPRRRALLRHRHPDGRRRARSGSVLAAAGALLRPGHGREADRPGSVPAAARPGDPLRPLRPPRVRARPALLFEKGGAPRSAVPGPERRGDQRRRGTQGHHMDAVPQSPRTLVPRPGRPGKERPAAVRRGARRRSLDPLPAEPHRLRARGDPLAPPRRAAGRVDEALRRAARRRADPRSPGDARKQPARRSVRPRQHERRDELLHRQQRRLRTDRHRPPGQPVGRDGPRTGAPRRLSRRGAGPRPVLFPRGLRLPEERPAPGGRPPPPQVPPLLQRSRDPARHRHPSRRGALADPETPGDGRLAASPDGPPHPARPVRDRAKPAAAEPLAPRPLPAAARGVRGRVLRLLPVPRSGDPGALPLRRGGAFSARRPVPGRRLDPPGGPGRGKRRGARPAESPLARNPAVARGRAALFPGERVRQRATFRGGHRALAPFRRSRFRRRPPPPGAGGPARGRRPGRRGHRPLA